LRALKSVENHVEKLYLFKKLSKVVLELGVGFRLQGDVNL
jgi:hypothetical protein